MLSYSRLKYPNRCTLNELTDFFKLIFCGGQGEKRLKEGNWTGRIGERNRKRDREKERKREREREAKTGREKETEQKN